MSEESLVKEPSRFEMLSNLLTNEAFHDVKLEGTDGFQVGANRCALSARNEVFEKMLFGSFQESKSDVVKIGFNGSTLQAIVEYIHTDDATIFQKAPKEKSDAVTQVFTDYILALPSLLEAADYFGLCGLRRKIFESALKSVRLCPSLSFALIEASRNEGPSLPETLVKRAYTAIRHNTYKVVESCAVTILTVPVLTELLQSDNTGFDDYQLFALLKQWVEGSKSNEASLQNRKDVGPELMKHIDLRQIDIEFLSDSVASSGLASIEQLAEAYKEHALSTKPEPDEDEYEYEDGDYPKKKPRLTIPVWKSSKAHVIAPYNDNGDDEFLDVDPIKSGIVRWTIEFRSTDRVEFFCGVKNGDNYFGLNEFGSVALRGRKHCDVDDISGFDFGNGGQLTMTLNLLANEEENGTLSFSINDGDTNRIVSNMREDLKGDGGFTPFIKFYNRDGIRIVDYEVVAS